jgi:hypothetical protein
VDNLRFLVVFSRLAPSFDLLDGGGHDGYGTLGALRFGSDTQIGGGSERTTVAAMMMLGFVAWT